MPAYERFVLAAPHELGANLFPSVRDLAAHLPNTISDALVFYGPFLFIGMVSLRIFPLWFLAFYFVAGNNLLEIHAGDGGLHYSAMLSVLLFIAVLDALSRSFVLSRRKIGVKYTNVLFSALLVPVVISTATRLAPLRERFRTTEEVRAVQRWVAETGSDPVLASYPLAAVFSSRREIYVEDYLPNGMSRADVARKTEYCFFSEQDLPRTLVRRKGEFVQVGGLRFVVRDTTPRFVFLKKENSSEL